LGGLGLASAIFILVRLIESWRVTTDAVSHHISILGQSVSYPAANVEAVLLVALAAMGAVVVTVAVSAAVREGWRSRRFMRRLAGMNPQARHGALVIGDSSPRAFCAGLLRPRVYVSTVAVEVLDEAALEAVLAHERHHASRRDPLRLAAGRVLAQALFFLPGLRGLADRQQALAELSADERAVDAVPERRSALARAMLSFSDASGTEGTGGVDPARIDYLLGEPPSWRFPALLFLAGGVIIALLVTLAWFAGQLASGSATLALPFLSRQPCIVVLALIPALAGSLGVACARRAPSSSRTRLTRG
jgi:Zn-dependent protease with chaperone function